GCALKTLVFLAHLTETTLSSRPCVSSRGEARPQHPGGPSGTALGVVSVGSVSIAAILSHPCLVWHTHLCHTGTVRHQHGRGGGCLSRSSDGLRPACRQKSCPRPARPSTPR